MAACQAVGAWPFSGLPAEVTTAQLYMMDEALRQLNQQAEGQAGGPAPAGPQQLRGKMRDLIYADAVQRTGVSDGNNRSGKQDRN